MPHDELRAEDEPLTRLAVVLPLRPEARDQAARLLAGGPPFDPVAAGLERHEAFVTDAEAVFSFTAADEGALEALGREAAVWAAASEWAELAAGPPRVGEGVYAWSRPADGAGVWFAPTPGPGDSEGGDVFAPAV